MSIRLRDLRARAGLTQEQIAEATDLKYGTYVKIENGQRGGSRETLQKLADYYGIPLEKLVYGDRGDPEGDAPITIPLPKSFTPAQIQQVRDFIGYLEWKNSSGAGYRSEGVREEVKEFAAERESGIDTKEELIPVIKQDNDRYPK